MIQKPPTDDATQKASVVKKIDWEDFRDHLSTADKEGRRIWIYPRKPRGNFYRARTWFTWVLLAVMFLGPFITIKGEPLLLVDILNGKFSILGRFFGRRTPLSSPSACCCSSWGSPFLPLSMVGSGADGPARKL